jgi:hypothetical protein
MAGLEGFEPPNARTKTWCLTTWRQPNMVCIIPYKTPRLKGRALLLGLKNSQLHHTLQHIVRPAVGSLQQAVHNIGIATHKQRRFLDRHLVGRDVRGGFEEKMVRRVVNRLRHRKKRRRPKLRDSYFFACRGNIILHHLTTDNIIHIGDIFLRMNQNTSFFKLAARELLNKCRCFLLQ